MEILRECIPRKTRGFDVKIENAILMATYRRHRAAEFVGHLFQVHPVYTRIICNLYNNFYGDGMEAKPEEVPRGRTGRPINLPESSFKKKKKNLTVGRRTDILLKRNKSRDGDANYDQRE